MSGGTLTLEAVGKHIAKVQLARPVRVGIDGRTASGKTTLADRLALLLKRHGRPVIRASIDDFHHPAAVRYRQGRLSADGYYEDARDLAAIRRLLLDPLGPDGDRRFATRHFDLAADAPLKPRFANAPENSILIVDGTFLQRPELRPDLDLIVFLDVPEDEALRRGIARDPAQSERHRRRYQPAFDRYVRECAPLDNADFVVSG